VQLYVKNHFFDLYQVVEHKTRKPSGRNQKAFSNQKPLTIKPYLMIIAANVEDNDSKKDDIEIIDVG